MGQQGLAERGGGRDRRLLARALGRSRRDDGVPRRRRGHPLALPDSRAGSRARRIRPLGVENDPQAQGRG